MLYNFFLIALRNIKKQRGYALVNIGGLAVGIASVLFILLYIVDELTYDSMHPQAENTYRIGYWEQTEDGEVNQYPLAPAGWDNYLNDNYASVTAHSSFSTSRMPTTIEYRPTEKMLLTEDIIWAEQTIGSILYLPILQGDSKNPLKEINSIILSRSAASQIFGEEEPLGKSISVSHMVMTNQNKVELIVSAIMDDMPTNSHLKPKFIANILALKPYLSNLEASLQNSIGSGNDDYWTQSFIVCPEPSALPTLQSDIQKRIDQELLATNSRGKAKMIIKKITDVHFDQAVDWSVYHKSANKLYIYVFASIALMILLVASVNYINLATAKSAARAREIGLRKTFGGLRKQLIAQFLTESFLLVFFSTLVAIILLALFLPSFNSIAQKDFSLPDIFSRTLVVSTLAIVLVISIIAGSYPAFFVSGFEPAKVLKGKFAFRSGANVVRQSLTVFQFTVAVTLLCTSLVVMRQMNLMKESKLNEAGSQIVSIRYGGFSGPTTNNHFLTFKDQLSRNPQIKNVTLANHLPRQDFFGPINMEFQFPEVSEQRLAWSQLNGDYDFLRTFDLKLLAGRDFDYKNTADSNAVILNRTAVAALKLSPEEALGKIYSRPDVRTYGDRDTTLSPITGIVVGVVEDFPYRSLHNKIDPLAISARPHFEDRIIHIRIAEGSFYNTISSIESTWKSLFPAYAFDYWFINDEFNRMYEREIQMTRITETFSVIAILITCVGLYGLATFMSEQKTKEIGIRKTLGSSNAQVVLLQLKVFGKIVALAVCIGLPIAYAVSNWWLSNFAYQTNLSVEVFGLSVLMISLLTILTVGYETLKASLVNPVKALKHD